MIQNLIGILILASAFCATYGFLYVCQRLEGQLDKRGLTAEAVMKKRQAEWQSPVADSDMGSPDPTTKIV